jgi:hypothetical protein
MIATIDENQWLQNPAYRFALTLCLCFKETRQINLKLNVLINLLQTLHAQFDLVKCQVVIMPPIVHA